VARPGPLGTPRAPAVIDWILDKASDAADDIVVN
jgi:hypothetical protein